MTTNANVRIRRKFVRFVAAQTRVVICGLRSDRLRVTTRARRDRNVRWRMRLVAIGATHAGLVVCVGEHALGVATDAILDDYRRCVVKLVTVETIGRRVGSDRGGVSLGIRVTRDTSRRFGIGREGVTGHAVGLQCSITLMRV